MTCSGVADPTIEQLLTHTAGFTAADGLEVADRHDNGPGAVRRAVADLKHSGTVGEYAYTSADYLVLGAVVEAVTGRPYPEVLESELLRPLGMRDSSGTEAGAEGLPPGHRQWWARPIRYDPGADESAASYGSVISTLTDIERYATAQLRGPGIPAEIRVEMQRPWVESSSDHYGLGWSVTRLDGEPIVHHTGATPGYFSHLLLAPGQDKAIVILANSYSEVRAPALGTGARDLWQIIGGQRREPAGTGGPIAAMPLILTGLAVVALGLVTLTFRRPLRRQFRWACGALALLGGLGLALLPEMLGHRLRTLWIWMPDATVGLIAAVGLLVLAGFGWLRPVRAPDRGRGIGR